MKAVVLLSILSASLAAQPAAIDGIVVDQTSGRPLARVQVHLMTGNTADGVTETYGATSDAAGHFSIASLKAGRYQALLERTGYVQLASRQGNPLPAFTIKPGQHLSDLKMEMARTAILSGRVLDDYGDPVPATSVQLMPVPPAKLSPTVMGNAGPITDDRGEFHILTGPGRYYLQATPPRFGNHDPPEIRSDGTSELNYSLTYYPHAATKDRASVVEVSAGRDLGGLDIHLTSTASQHPLTVSGIVTNLPDGGSAFLVLLPTGTEQQISSSAMVRPDGKFSISGLLPGAYKLVVRTEFSKPSLRGGAQFTLENSDIANLQVSLEQPGELIGTLDTASAPAGAPMAGKRTVSLIAADSASAFGAGADRAYGDVDRDGSFRLTNVWPGNFHPVVELLPENAYLKTIELDGSPVTGGVIELAGGTHVPKLKITVALDGALVSGKVMDKDGEPMTGDVTIYLIADHKTIKEATLTELEDGKFSLSGIRPGKYRLFAADFSQLSDDSDTAERNDLIDHLLTAEEEIEIRPGERIAKDLKIKSKEAADAKKQ